MPLVLHHHPGEILPSGPGLLHVPQRDLRIHVHQERAVRWDVLRYHVHVDRAADRREGPCLVRMGHLLGAHREHHIVHPGGHLLPRQVQCRGGGGACVLHIDDRHLAQAEGPQRELAEQHLLPGDRARNRITEMAGLDITSGPAGVGKGPVHRFGDQILQGASRLFREPGHGDPGDAHASHLDAATSGT